MSVHGDAIVAAFQEELRFGGDEISYVAPGEDAVALTAIVGHEQAATQDEDDRRTLRRERTVTISRDPSSAFGGVANPFVEAASHKRAYFVIDGENWTIIDTGTLSAAMAELRCVVTATLEITGPKVGRY